MFEVLDIVEKPALDEAPSHLAVAARYVFAPRIFEALARTKPGKGGEIQLTDAIKLLIEDGEKVYGIRLNGAERRYDIGNFESYFRAFVEFALADEKYGAGLREYLATVLNRA
ncbi:MAG TPA: sugar phosphate nucleotidyltransferase [Phototrophicaceae bacterium]|nr:sugar phosphate nucleotidyltransferase [Phototrophicaceae bacterium]